MFRSSVTALLALSALALTTAAGAAVPIPPPPDLDAGSYILIDSQSGDVIAQKNADERMEPASLTKLLTSYVVFAALKDGRLKLDDRSRSARPRGVPAARGPSSK